MLRSLRIHLRISVDLLGVKGAGPVESKANGMVKGTGAQLLQNWVFRSSALPRVRDTATLGNFLVSGFENKRVKDIG